MYDEQGRKRGKRPPPLGWGKVGDNPRLEEKIRTGREHMEKSPLRTKGKIRKIGASQSHTETEHRDCMV